MPSHEVCRRGTSTVGWTVALATLAVPLTPAAASAQYEPIDAFDGSYRLETGEILTGGHFVEGGEGRWLYMDTENLDRGALLERTSGTTLRSLFPPGAVELEFSDDGSGRFDTMIWKQDGRELRGERIFPHTSREIAFTSADGTELRGRLLTPRCEAPHPLIVSVHGSGPVNRYGGPFQTFFLQHGIAVLAYDKRGYTTESGAWHEPDLADLSADAAAAIRFAATLPEIDTSRIGYSGSSQAGWTMPPAAVDAGADFMIVRAGAALEVFETVMHEIRQEARIEGLTGLDLDAAMDLRRELYTLARRGEPISAADRVAAPYMDREWYRAAFGDGPISELWSARWWSWMGRNAAFGSADALARFEGPVLWFLGEHDEAVPLVSTRAALERAFERASRRSPDAPREIVVLERAPHSFLVPAEHDGPPRYADGFFNRMGSWLAEQGIGDVGCSPGESLDWPVSSPAEQGLDARPFEALDADVRAGRYGYIDHLMILRHGRVVVNEHYARDYVAASAGADPTPHQYNYHHPDWHPYFSGRDVHSLQSITKSITSALIGIAIGRGEIAGVEEPIVSFLGEYDLSGTDPRFRRATIEDLLTMRTGIEWHETDRPADSTNTTIQLEGSDDWVKFVLEQPMDADPGERWVYNSGTSHLMSEIIRSATGFTVDQYAEAHLFGPLDIDDYHWKITPTGLPDTEGGLYLEPADLARIGQLYLDDGVWNGRRILPEGWVASSTARHADPVNEQGWGYGYQWWRVDRDDIAIWAALGYGGQHLIVMPEFGLVGVVNAWNLFEPPNAPMFPAVLDAMLDAAR